MTKWLLHQLTAFLLHLRMVTNPKIALIAGILCIAFSPIFVKFVPSAPISSAFYRIFIAWLCLLPYCIIKGQLRIDKKYLPATLLGGLIFASDIAIWNLSLVRISATVSTLVANLAPVWVGLMSYLIFRKRAGKLFWIGTVIAIFGMAVLVGFKELAGLQFNIGLVYAVIASIFYASYIMVTKKVLQNINVVTFMFYNMLASSVFLLIINLFMHNNLTSFPASSWLSFVGLGLICQLVGWLTLNYAINHMDATKVSIALLSQTVIAAMLAALLLHEKLQFKEIAGSIIVLGGIAITFLKKQATA